MWTGGAEGRVGGVTFRKLLGRNLREAAGLRDFEPDRAGIDDAEIAGETGRTFGPQLHGIDRLGEGADRCLGLDVEGELILLRLVELDDEVALIGICARLDVPGDDLFALHTSDLARAVQ